MGRWEGGEEISRVVYVGMTERRVGCRRCAEAMEEEAKKHSRAVLAAVAVTGR